jgi:hypothetical protein
MRAGRFSVVVAVVAVAIMALAPAASATPRSGELHITKDCSDYRGQAGGFCTIRTSSLAAIPADSRIVYASAIDGATLDTDISITVGPGNTAHGHCTLDFLALPGVCTLEGGSGKFTHLRAHVVVSPDPGTANLWHCDGVFAFEARS